MGCTLRIWPNSSSKVGKLIRLKDWNATLLGDAQLWPDTLRYALTQVLNHPLPLLLLWGEELICFYNDACIPLLSDQHPQALGKPLQQSLPEQFVLHQNIAQTVRTKRHSVTLRNSSIGSLSGSTTMFTLIYVPLEDLGGRAQGVIISVVEQRGDAEHHLPSFIALDEPTPQAHLLQEGINLTRWELDASGDCLLESVSWRAYTGQSPADAKDKGWLSAVHPDDRNRVVQHWQRAATEKRPFAAELRIQCHGSAWAWNALYALPISDHRGQLVRWMGMTVDISAQKRADELRRQTDAQCRIAVEAGGIGTWQIDLDSMAAYGSNRLLAMMGIPQYKQVYPAEEWQHYVLEQDRPQMFEAIQKTIDEGCPYDCYFRVRIADGSIHWLHGRAEIHTDAVSGKKLLIGATMDITHQRHTEEQLLVENRNLSLVLSGAGEAMWEYDIPSQRITNSPELNVMLGLPRDEPPWDESIWLKRIHPEDLPRMAAARADVVTGKADRLYQEYRLRTSDQQWKWVLSRGTVVERDKHGQPLRMIGMISDISARKEADEQIWRLANLDTLTSLPNRRLFKDRLAHAILNAQRHHRMVALMFLDLDRFKQVNDLYGHDAGDNLLRQASARLVRAVRHTDTVARLAGDEFTIILDNLQGDRIVEQVAQKVIHALAKPFDLGNNDRAHVSGSIGIAMFPHDACAPDDLIRKADQAMYAAKKAGRNQFSYFTRDMDEKAHARLNMIEDLRRSITLGALSLVLQPIVDVRTQRIVKAEAFLRWHHPVLGEVRPAQFLPLAQEAGILPELGDYVFRHALKIAKGLRQKTGQAIQVTINSSPGQFTLRHKDKWLKELRRQNLPAHSLALEVGESILQGDAVTSKRLRAYHEAGMDMAVDNFGSGISSLSRLVEYPVDYLKIDRSFTCDMVNNQKHRVIVESTIAMAHRMDLAVSAEGVETEQQYRMLRQVECDYAQGYYLSHPLQPDTFMHLVMLNRNGNWPQLPH